MIYISNNLFLFPVSSDINDNNPIIGYSSVLRPEDITAPVSFPSRPASNAWSHDTSVAFVGAGLPGNATQYLVLHNINNEPVDYIGIAKHNFGSSGREIVIQESNDGVTWTNVSPPQSPTDDAAIFNYFDERTTTFFRIDMDDTAVSQPIVGHVKLGKALVLQRRIYAGHKPARITKMVKKTTYGSETGQYLGQVVHRSYNKTELQQENNSPQFVREKIKPFIEHINGHAEIENTAVSTFFFAWRPSSYPDEVVYGWTNDNIQPENTGGDGLGGRMSWGMSIEAVA